MIEKIILKKSSVLDKMPSPEQLEYGEIAINYNAAHPFLSFKDSDGDIMPLNDYSQDIAYLYSHKLDAGVLDTINENTDAIKKKLNISDFNTFKADNTKTLNALDRNVSQNGSEIQEVNGIVQNHTTAIATINTSIAQKADKTELDTINANVDQKVSKTDIVQNTGQSTTSVMSQNAVSDALSSKVDKSDIVQSTGTSETAVMSQKASTMAFAANTPSGDPMHNLYVEVGAIYNDTGNDIERVDQWGDTIIHKDGCWYLNGLGDLTNADMNRCWVYANCIYHGYNFNISGYGGFDVRTNIPYISNGLPPNGGVYNGLNICNWKFDTFAFNDITFKDASLVSNIPLRLGEYDMYFSQTIKFYGFVVCERVDKNTFYRNDITECIGLILTSSAYINLPKLRADCIRQIISAVRATGNITITLHPKSYERAIADTGVQEALANKTNVSLAKGE